jgi:hypothetical protein
MEDLKFKEIDAYNLNEIFDKKMNLFLFAASNGSKKCLDELYYQGIEIFN